MCWAALPSAPGQTGDPADGAGVIKAVGFTGVSRANETLVRDLVRINPGEEVDVPALDEAVARLVRSGRFVSAVYKLDQQPDGMRVTFELRERPLVTAIRFEGNKKFSDARLREHVSQKLDSPVDWLAVRDGREAMVTKYKQEGFAGVAVTYDQEELERTGTLVYRIQEGQQVRIREVVFEGNSAFPARVLKRHVSTKPWLWLLRPGAFDEDQIEGDVVRVQTYYRDHGFLDARVTYRREVSADGADLTVVFIVEEGVPYAVEALEFRGNAALSTEELQAFVTTGVGERVERQRVDADVRAVQDRYGELGYIYATVRPIRVFSETPGYVRLAMEISEGEQYRVGRVVVRGNARTKDKVARRALNLYPPDDLFDVPEAREAERRLKETRVFGSARVYPVGDSPGVRDAVIDVEEAERAGDFLFGFGVTSNSGLVGNIVLDLQNFDLFDWPVSWAELFKFRSFFGGGQRMRLELQPGVDVNRYRISFTEPYLFDKPLRFDLDAYLFERGRDGYDEERAGGRVSFGRRFERGWMRGWSAELSPSIENVEVDDIDVFASEEIRDDEGSNFLTSIKGTLVRDRTDSRFLPTRGDRLTIAYEQFGILGGDHTFGKLSGAYIWYKTLRTDLLERKSVLQLRAEGGVILGDAPIFERFYAGGTGSIRGFEFRGVGPRDGIDQNIVGGDSLILLGGEYSFPLVGENVRGLFFVDSGSLDVSSWAASVGVGVRFTLDVFGPVPIELDLALPVVSDSDDEEQIFSFMIGSLF